MRDGVGLIMFGAAVWFAAYCVPFVLAELGRQLADWINGRPRG